MFRKTVFAYAAAAAICFAAATAATGASADSAAKTPQSTGAKALAGSNGGGATQCWEAECGGDTVPIDDNYIVRGCNMTPGDAELPPWCEDSAGGLQPKKATLHK